MRKADILPYLRPDGKAQVTVRFEVDEHGHRRPVEIERVLISTQHREGLDVDSLLRPDLLEHVVEPILHVDYGGLFNAERLHAKDFFYVNPTGKFVIGGPMGDTGLTGRKIIVDSYGGAAPHGGGAFSGKDPTKVDRSAAYAARYVAKNVVAAGLAGALPDPGRVRDRRGAPDVGARRTASARRPTACPARGSSSWCASTSTCGPAAILRDLDLLRPIYAKTAAYGHFGRDDRDFTWERTDKADALRAAAGLDGSATAGANGSGDASAAAPVGVARRVEESPAPPANSVGPWRQTDDLQKTLIAALQRNRGELDPVRLAEVLRRLAATAAKPA